MPDLDAAARQALQDVLALKEEAASATEDLAELKALITEIEAVAERDGDALGDELERGAAEADLEQKRLERAAEQSDDAADGLHERWEHAREEVKDLMRRLEGVVSGFGEWLDEQDGVLEDDLRTLDEALDDLEDAARDAVRSNGEAVDSLVERCEALREHDLERFETEGMEQARLRPLSFVRF